MEFLFLPGLLALISLPIIVWLHLRRQRLKRVTVPSLLLWHNLPTPKRSERKRWLPITLLLLLHLLIATLVSIALAQPQTLQWLLDRRQHVAVVIDTSTSMGARDTASGTRLDDARRQTQAMIESLQTDDHIALIAAGPQAHLLTAGGMGNRVSLQSALEDLQPVGTGSDLEGALMLARTVLQAESEGQATEERKIVVLSDLEQPPEMPAFDAALEWKRLGGNSGNRAVVALAARPRGNQRNAGSTLYARFANYGDETLTTPFRLFADGDLIDTHLVVFQPDGEIEYTWDLPADVDVVHVELDGQDNLPADDSASLGLDQQRTIKTLIVSANPEPLERVLNLLPELNVLAIEPENYPSSQLAVEAELTVFDSTLAGIRKWPAGGVLVINPPVENQNLLPIAGTQPVSGTTAHVYEEGLALLEDLNLDSITFGTVAEVQTPTWANVLLGADEVPLIMRGNVADSTLAVWTFDISPLTTRLVFPLLVARTVRDLIPPSLPPSLLAGSPLPLQFSPRADMVELHTPDGAVRQLASDDDHGGNSALLREDIQQPGLYRVVEQHEGTILYEGAFAVNTGTPLESDLRARPAQARMDLPVIASVSNGSNAVSQMQEEMHPIWSWFALAALVILMVEWVYYTGQIQAKRVK